MECRVFYLVGPPRSGSTLIYNALCSNNVFNPPLPETHLASWISKIFYDQKIRNENIEKKFFLKIMKIIKNILRNSQCDLARIYKLVTLILNMKPDEHEFKIMEMANILLQN